MSSKEYTWLDLKRSVLGIGILSFSECGDWFRRKLAVGEGETFPDIILCIKTPLLSLSLRGRIDRKL